MFSELAEEQVEGIVEAVSKVQQHAEEIQGALHPQKP